MRIGARLKELRLINGLTQEELADRCELTKGYISQLENDLTSPSIMTLTDLLSVLGMTLGKFFTREEERKLVFTPEECFEKEADGLKITWMIPTSDTIMMEPMIVEFEPNAETDKDIPHEGEEFGYVLDGEVTLYYGKRKIAIKAGESFYYDSTKPHYIKNESDVKSKIIWVTDGE